MHITGRINGTEQNVLEMMIEFTKIHVEQALKEASTKLDYNKNFCTVQKEILNSYPLKNIK